MTIRKITPTDRREYIEMAKEFYSSSAAEKSVPQEYFAATSEECLRSDAYAECFVFEEEGVLAGYGLIAKTFSQEAGGAVVWFEELYVRPQFRGRGFGSRFFTYVFRERPAARYRLEVVRSNARAIALYRRLGFGFLDYDQMIRGN